MSVKHAIYDVATFKASGDEDNGQFEAMVSVFGNVDKQGDRVVKGAFDKTLAEWKATGAPIPIIWHHQWGDPNAHIGSADPNDVVETDAGLKVAGKIDLDNPFAAQVYRLLKERRVKEFSFGYEVRKEKKSKDDGANDLIDLGLIEVGPTLKGANPSTELLAVKSELDEAAAVGVPYLSMNQMRADEKAGRRISRATESEIRAALEDTERLTQRLSGLLATAGDEEEEEKGLASLGDATDATDDNEAEADGKANVDPQIAALKAQLNMIGD